MRVRQKKDETTVAARIVRDGTLHYKDQVKLPRNSCTAVLRISSLEQLRVTALEP